MTQDNKLLAGVAALVVAGAAGIAFLASLSVDRTTERIPPPERPRASASRIETAPVSREDSASRAIVPAVHFEPDAEVVTPAPSPEPVFDDPVAAGLSAWGERRYDVAALAFEQAAEATGDRAWIHYMLGLSRWKDGDLDGALESMERAVDLDPHSVRAHVNHSRIENDRGAYDAALEAARTALTLAPGDATALFLEGRSLRNLGLREEALTSLERSVAADPDNAYALNLLGLTLIETDSESRATEVLSRAAQLEPDLAYIQNNLGMALERTGNRAGAVLAYSRAAQLDGGSGPAIRNLARLDPDQRMQDAIAEAGSSDAVAGAAPPDAPESVPGKETETETGLAAEDAAL